MYKLIVISGPIRGTSYVLSDGELSIGRQAGNGIVLQSSKVSKRHCVFTIEEGEVVLKDNGSSNGTFVNGILTKLRKLVPGDRISVGEYVFELSEIQKGVLGQAPAVAGMGNMLQLNTSGALIGAGGASSGDDPLKKAPPKNLKEKAIWYFENKFMLFFYNMNLKNEWKIICAGVFSVFILSNLFITVYPLLDSSQEVVEKETGRRAAFMARQIAETNAPFLAARMETKTDIGLAESAEGVRVAVLIDMTNRIIAPSSKMNQMLVSGAEARKAIQAKNMFENGKEGGFYAKDAFSSLIIAIEPVKIFDPSAGRNVVRAMSLVSIDTSLAVPDTGELAVIYSETLIFTGLLGGFMMVILYYLTLKPLLVLNDDMDKALKGDLAQVTHEYKFEEMNPLWDIINSAIQRIQRSGSSPDSDMGGVQEEGVDAYLGPVKMLAGLFQFGLVIFDPAQKIVFLNPLFEEMSGIREDGAIGREMVEVARDQSMAAFTSDLLGRTPVGGDGVSEVYDFSGIPYKISTAAFGSPGGLAKCFIFVAVKAEG
jgi:hypothetical protein